MPITITIEGTDDQGYKTTFGTTVESFDEEGTKQYRLLQSYVGIAGLVAKAAPAPSAPSGSFGGDIELTCQFCSGEVKGVEKFGNMKSDMSAAEVARSRSEKMGKMGKPAKPVCSKCWSQGGHAKAWDEYYRSNRR